MSEKLAQIADFRQVHIAEFIDGVWSTYCLTTIPAAAVLWGRTPVVQRNVNPICANCASRHALRQDHLRRQLDGVRIAAYNPSPFKVLR